MNASPATAAHQVAAFYAGSRLVRWIGHGLRAAHRVSPGVSLRLALRLFFTPLPSKLKARARPVPAGWHERRLPFERGGIALWEHEGAAPDAPRVLLVHGWAGDAMQMRPLAERLVAAGYAPLLLDFPGHGRSDGWRSTLPQFVRALFAVQARIGPLHGLVAHSLGALAGARAVAQGLAARRLVMVSPPIPPAVFVHGFAHSFGLDSALARRMGELIQQREGVPLREFEPAWLGPRVPHPTLLVHDRDDRAAPLAAAQALAAALPGATLLVTQGLGHRRILDDADTVHAAVLGHLGGPIASVA